MQRNPLPPILGDRFSTAEARHAGVSADRLRALDLDRSTWGVRQLNAPRTLIRRCELLGKRLRPDSFYSHSTAALLFGAPLPFELEHTLELHVGVALPAPAPHARGIIGHHSRMHPMHVIARGALRVTSPARTWADLATILELGDLVAVGDFFIQHSLPMCTQAELASASFSGYVTRGIRLLRQALPLLSDRAESRPESRLRIIVVLAGLPSPDVNHVVVQTETGAEARLDLAFTRERVVLEYQGNYHRTRQQWRADMTRRARLEADGWYLMEINADDLNGPTELVARIRKVLARR